MDYAKVNVPFLGNAKIKNRATLKIEKHS